MMLVCGLVGLAIGAAMYGPMGAFLGGLLGIVAGLGIQVIRASERDAGRKEAERKFAQHSNSPQDTGAQQQNVPDSASPEPQPVNEAASVPPAATPREQELPPPAEPAAVAQSVPMSAPRPDSDEKAAAPAASQARSSTAAVAKVATKPPPPVMEGPSLLERLLSGNLLAKVGVVLLLIAVGSLLKIAAENIVFPIEVRLAAVSALAFAMVAFGWIQRELRRVFALAMQGGGIAVLYMVVYFMHSGYAQYANGGYQMIGTAPAFVLFAALGWSCILLAVVQDGAMLALIGIAGAFLAPVLSAGHTGSHLVLFSYYVVLNALIIAANLIKGWRQMNVIGFLCTFVVGFWWARGGYLPEQFATTEFFLLLFFLMYSLTPVLFALLREPGLRGLSDAIIVFGTPGIVLALQAPLVQEYEYGLAISAAAAGLYYFGLFALLRAKRNPDMRFMEEAHAFIGIALVTFSVPLWFRVSVTSAVLALEGCALVWFGAARARGPVATAGILIQIAAGGYFFLHTGDLSHANPILNDIYIGCVLIAAAGIASSYFLRRAAAALPSLAEFALLLGIWGFSWWFIASIVEILEFVPRQNAIAAMLAFVVISLAAMEFLGSALQWERVRGASTLALAAIIVAVVFGLGRDGHLLQGWMLTVFPLAMAVHFWILYRHERAGIDPALGLQHIFTAWFLTLFLAWEWAWQARQIGGAYDALWELIAYGMCFALFSLVLLALAATSLWPVRGREQSALAACGIPLVFVGALWVLYANSANDGAWGRTFVPLFNPLDIASLILLLTGWQITGHAVRRNALSPEAAVTLKAGLGVAAFWWINALAARSVHHYTDIPYTVEAMLRSVTFQSILSFMWTLAAIAVMIHATRIASRKAWFAGFAILGIVGAKMLILDLRNLGSVSWTLSLLGIALLVIAASYFAPTPPKAGGGDSGAAA